MAGVAANIPLSDLRSAPKTTLSDDQLLDLVQRQTLKYFCDFAEPNSGMARERSNNIQAYGQDVVSTGASGFGIMAMIAGQSRGWLTHDDTLSHISKIVHFLENADQYHGMFSHYMDKQGKTIALDRKDDGADIVETSYLMMGLLTARQHFSGDSDQEKELRRRITKLWERADWRFFERENETTHKTQLMWHWSPNYEWAMNLPVSGWNEALVTHVLAAASPTHAVSDKAYKEGWLGGKDFKNGKSHDGILLPLGPEKGGPLFFTQYSFMGLSPEGLKDAHADYWQQNTNHTLLNRQHCIKNPGGFKGYSPECWGLTASDDPGGYEVHSPTCDSGVISPTAAIASFPYTPEFSMAAMRHFYEQLGDKIWGEYGFTDAFNQDKNWYAKTYIGIDQGPIITMIENHRSGLLWKEFMSCPEVKTALKKLDFESPYLTSLPPELIRIQEHSSNAGDFLDKLCGPKGYKPLTDTQFAKVTGLSEDATWQARELRSAKQLLSLPQKEKLLRYCGYSDPEQSLRAYRILATPTPNLAVVR